MLLKGIGLIRVYNKDSKVFKSVIFQFRVKWLKSMFGKLDNKIDAERLSSFLQNKLLQILQSDNNLILSDNFKMSILIIKAN